MSVVNALEAMLAAGWLSEEGEIMPEENKAKPESATTVCSAAGGDVEQDKTGRSADWQAEFNELLGLVKEKCEAAERQFANLGHMELSGAARAYRATYEYMLSVTEAAAAK